MPAPSRSAPLRIVNAMLGRRLGGLEQTMLDYGDALMLAGHQVHAVIHPERRPPGAEAGGATLA